MNTEEIIDGVEGEMEETEEVVAGAEEEAEEVSDEEVSETPAEVPAE